MEKSNRNIKCDVRTCSHNLHGKNCSLNCVKITCADGDCTCCGNYENKES